jgi:hypothetical protein
VGEAVIIEPEGSDAKGESWGLEDLFERPQISRQTRMPNLMEGKSTRRVGSSRPKRLPARSWRRNAPGVEGSGGGSVRKINYPSCNR